MEDNSKLIGESLYRFQSAINESGISLEEYIRNNYTNKWLSDNLYNAMAIRTTFVNAMNQYLVNEDFLIFEKVYDERYYRPPGHDIEHTPSIAYKGHTYVTTHSMIYSKFMSCSNRKIKGVFVDSPNIRLEIESPVNEQRGKYLADFSQMDIELNRNSGIDLDTYYNKPDQVLEILNADNGKSKRLF